LHCTEFHVSVLRDMIGVIFPAGAGNFSLRHRFQTGSGAHPASRLNGACCSFIRSKAVGGELTTHIHLAPRLIMRGAIIPLQSTFSWNRS